MYNQKIKDGAQTSTESGKEGWGYETARRTVFQTEGTASAKARKYEEYDSLGLMKDVGG